MKRYARGSEPVTERSAHRLRGASTGAEGPKTAEPDAERGIRPPD
jgi:hypothetical protein